jgi:hypothetical protein
VQQKFRYSITSSVTLRTDGGTVRPSILVVWWLITNLKLLDYKTGNEPELSAIEGSTQALATAAQVRNRRI